MPRLGPSRKRFLRTRPWQWPGLARIAGVSLGPAAPKGRHDCSRGQAQRALSDHQPKTPLPLGEGEGGVGTVFLFPIHSPQPFPGAKAVLANYQKQSRNQKPCAGPHIKSNDAHSSRHDDKQDPIRNARKKITRFRTHCFLHITSVFHFSPEVLRSLRPPLPLP